MKKMIKKAKNVYYLIPPKEIYHFKRIQRKRLLSFIIYIKRINITLHHILILSLIVFNIIILISINTYTKIKNKIYKEIEFKNTTVIEGIKNEDINIEKLNKSSDEEINDSQNYIDICMENPLINQGVTFYKSENPKITVVVSMFNAEAYIKYNLCSIQHQNFHDIEIIIIDDYSKDNSVNLVKDLMKTDPRIILHQNEENKGTLYSKTKGVLMAKGKYVLIIDQDDMYIQNDAFSTMYKEMEKDNLDILGFGSILADTTHLKEGMKLNLYINSPIIYQPYISRRMFSVNSKGEIVRVGDFIWNYIYKKEIFIKSIMQIDDKTMNTKMNCHEDFLLFFLLTRNAYKLKQIKRLFYAHINWIGDNNPKILFTRKEKKKNKENLKCMSFMNYIEFLLLKTNNDINDKKIASYELKIFYLNSFCKYNKYVEKRGIYVCKLFLENKYITDDVKNEIKSFLQKKGAIRYN